jgi:hypothetical protein
MAPNPKKYLITFVLNNVSASLTGIGHAIEAAGPLRHNVKGSDQTTLNAAAHREVKDDGSIWWHVWGDLHDVVNMSNRWTGGADVDDNGNYLPPFTPKVLVKDPPKPE